MSQEANSTSQKRTCRFIFWSILSAGLLISLPSLVINAKVSAVSQNEFDESIQTNSNCGSTQSTLKKYLLDSSYNETAAAGIMGAVAAESCGYKFSVYGGSCARLASEDFVTWKNNEKTFSGGFGLAQWTSRKRVKKLQEYADSLGKKVNSAEVQIRFIVKELKSSSYRLTPLALNSMSLPEASWVILRDYLVPDSIVCTEEDLNCDNQKSPQNISLSELLNNSSVYQSAYDAFVRSYNKAKQAYSSSIASCDSDNDQSGEKGQNEEKKEEERNAVETTGNLGAQSSKGYYSQCNTSYSNYEWRIDKSTICQSGQSLIAVANAAKYLEISPSDPITLAEWSQTNIKDISQTGWETANMSIPRLMAQLGLKQQNKLLWDKNTLLPADKIKKIREVLANGGVIIAQGKRTDDQSINCSDQKNMSAGLCVFSTNGHFVTIIGITDTDKLIITNVAHGKNGENSSDELPAENVLNASSKAIGVFKDDE